MNPSHALQRPPTKKNHFKKIFYRTFIVIGQFIGPNSFYRRMVKRLGGREVKGLGGREVERLKDREVKGLKGREVKGL